MYFQGPARAPDVPAFLRAPELSRLARPLGTPGNRHQGRQRIGQQRLFQVGHDGPFISSNWLRYLSWIETSRVTRVEERRPQILVSSELLF